MTVPALPTFNVKSRADCQRFLEFMRDVRRRLQDPHSASPIVQGEAAKLPPQQGHPALAGLIDLVLRNGDNGVTLRLRTDNLYVVGFRNGWGTWFEFRHDHGMSMIEPAEPKDYRLLPFDGSYTSRGLGDLENAMGEDILGPTAVAAAINGLAGYNGDQNKNLGRWLRNLIVNFIESTRFNVIANRVAGLMNNEQGPQNVNDRPEPEQQRIREYPRRLTPRNVKVIRNWASLSEALVIATKTPDAEDFSSFSSALGISNAFAAATALGMVLITREVGQMVDQRPRKRRSVDTGREEDKDDKPGMMGLTLVHVAGVLVNDIDRENPGQLYGRISVTDSFGTVDLFNRGHHGYQTVGPGGHADLIWPARAISGADGFVIDVYLKDYDFISPDDNVASGQVAWNSRDMPERSYNTVRSTKVTADCGSVDVQFAVLTDAVVALVEVVMVDGDGESSPDVYGTVTAKTRMVSGEPMEYELFNRTRDDQVSVHRNTDVPLKGTVIPVALGSVLEIRANLWDKDRDLSPDDQIALGSAEFHPRLNGSEHHEIKAKYGTVNVKVTWSTSFLPASKIPRTTAVRNEL